jgi:hypothetical protein
MTPAKVKTAVRARDGKCVKCGITTEQHREEFGYNMDVHRVVPGSFYTIEGCVTLCRKCHGPEPRTPRGVVPEYRQACIVRLKPRMAEALDAYIASRDVKPHRSQILAAALEEFLRVRGYHD